MNLDRAQLFFVFYYTMTGLHVIHMIVGIGLLTWQFVLAVPGFFDHQERYVYVEVLSLYWHFVELVWMFLLPLLYMAGHHSAQSPALVGLPAARRLARGTAMHEQKPTIFEHDHAEPAPTARSFVVFLVLAGLTAMAVLLGFVDFGPIRVWLSLGVAVTQAIVLTAILHGPAVRGQADLADCHRGASSGRSCCSCSPSPTT